MKVAWLSVSSLLPLRARALSFLAFGLLSAICSSECRLRTQMLQGKYNKNNTYKCEWYHVISTKKRSKNTLFIGSKSFVLCHFKIQAASLIRGGFVHVGWVWFLGSMMIVNTSKNKVLVRMKFLEDKRQNWLIKSCLIYANWETRPGLGGKRQESARFTRFNW